MLKFISMTIENFGPYKGSQTINFGDGDGITIVWGDNGHGKTTLLNIFNYALFGKFLYRHESIEDITSLVNKEGLEEGNYNFKVVLRMLYDGKKYELTRRYDVRKGVSVPSKKDDYVPSCFLKVDGSILSSSQSEHEISLIMPKDVARFFLFDGELLQQYEELVMDETAGGEEIKKAIESILGVPILVNSFIDIKFALDEYKEKQNKKAQANNQTKKYAARIEAEQATKKEQETELSRLQGELENVKKLKFEMEDLSKQNERISKLINERDNLNQNIEEHEKEKDEVLQNIKAETKDVWKIMLNERVQENLEQVSAELSALRKKETASLTSEQLMSYLQYIVKNHHCECCDQDVDEAHVIAIKKRLKDEPGLFRGFTLQEKERMEAIQGMQRSLKALQTSGDVKTLKILEDKLDGLVVRISDEKNKKNNLQDEISHYGNADKLANDVKKNTYELSKCYAKIENLTESIKKTKAKIEEQNKTIENLEDKINKAGKSDEELQVATKKVNVCEDLRNLFEEGISAYREKLKKDVERDATELFCNIRSDPDYTALKINDKYGLSIQHKSGEIIPFRSAGYEHIVALSLIGALHKNAPLSGPVVMDSPFGRIDPKHKENITKALPLLSHQIILLVYTDEIDSQTARLVLGDSIKKEYKLRKKSSFFTEIEELR